MNATPAMPSLMSLLSLSPWILITTIGAIVCLRRCNSDRPREGKFVGAAIGFVVLAKFAVPQLIGLVDSSAMNRDSIRFIEVLTNLTASTSEAIAWGLILYGAFGCRTGQGSRYLIEDRDEGNPIVSR